MRLVYINLPIMITFRGKNLNIEKGKTFYTLNASAVRTQ